MTITIELPDDLAEQLNSAGIPAEEAGRYAVAALSEVAGNAEIRAWWSHLSEKERGGERANERKPGFR